MLKQVVKCPSVELSSLGEKREQLGKERNGPIEAEAENRTCQRSLLGRITIDSNRLAGTEQRLQPFRPSDGDSAWIFGEGSC